jgi:DNA-binding response OmpR family regulator
MSRSTILLLDDEEAVLETTSAVLELEGYDVVVSSNGMDALDKVLKNPSIDIALLDIRMQPLSGVDVLAELKKMRPELPVLMISAFSSTDLENQAYHLGAYAFLRKPLDVDHLLRVIQTAISKPHVLIVSGTRMQINDLLQAALGEARHRVDSVIGEEDAIDYVQKNTCDIIIFSEQPSADLLHTLTRFRPQLGLLTLDFNRVTKTHAALSPNNLTKEQILQAVATLRGRRPGDSNLQRA